MSAEREVIATASVRCYCRRRYVVRWLPERKVDGLPIECECGVLAETLEAQARASLDLDARLVLAKRDAEIRRQAEEALDLLECESCGKAMRITPSVQALIAKHTPIHCDWPMRRVAAQEAAT